MKKTYLLLIVLSLSVFGELSAQGCLPNGIYFTSQSQIDAFPADYPGCTQILGDVFIGINITHLDSLSKIESIGGVLSIRNNVALTSLSGLDNLTSIGGGFEVTENDALTSLSGLDSLTYISELRVVDNAALTSLSGLSMTSIGYMEVRDNAALVSLNGLDNLTSIGLLKVLGNDVLTSLSGLDNLTSIDALLVSGNDALTSLSGLDNIDPTTISYLYITNCPNLVVCGVKSICDYLAIPTNPATIIENAIGCGTRAEVLTACAVGIEDPFKLVIQIFPYPTFGRLEIQGLAHGHLRIVNNLGEVVMEKTFSESVVDISHLPGGIYFLQVQSKDQWVSKKILKR
jgi:hypothetical protein